MSTTLNIELERYDRQLHAVGMSGMASMMSASYLLLGLTPTSVEVARNIILSGCRNIYLVDDSPVTEYDVPANFFVTNEDIGCPRGRTIGPRLRDLNPQASIIVLGEDVLTNQIVHSSTRNGVDHVDCTATTPIDVVIAINLDAWPSFASRSLSTFFWMLYSSGKTPTSPKPNPTKFIVGCCSSLVCAFRNDFGDEFVVTDPSGTVQSDESCLVSKIFETDDSEFTGCFTVVTQPSRDIRETLCPPWNIVLHATDDCGSASVSCECCIRDSRRERDHADTLRLVVKPVEGHLDSEVRARLLQPYDPRRPVFLRSFMPPRTMRFSSLHGWTDGSKHESVTLEGCSCDALALRLVHALHLRGEDEERSQELDRLEQQCSRDPQAAALVSVVRRSPHMYFHPLCSIVGGLIAQDALKAVSRKYLPTAVTCYFDVRWMLPPTQPDKIKDSEGGSCHAALWDPLKVIFGSTAAAKVRDGRVLVVGSGAIGCEYLKYFATLGLCSGKRGMGDVTDPDHIERSNLSRQFLFCDSDVGKPKSACAVAKIRRRSRATKLRSYVKLVAPATASAAGPFHAKYFESVDVICGAVDNNTARSFLDELCRVHEIPMIDSGTLGPQGHVVAVVPHVTQRLADTPSASDADDRQSAIPFCTLRFFPSRIEHCIEWALDLFSATFTRKVELPPVAFRLDSSLELDKDALEKHVLEGLSPADRLRKLQHFLDALDRWCLQRCYRDTTAASRLLFDLWYGQHVEEPIRQLLAAHPPASDDPEQRGFWNGKIIPKFPSADNAQRYNDLRDSFLDVLHDCSRTADDCEHPRARGVELDEAFEGLHRMVRATLVRLSALSSTRDDAAAVPGPSTHSSDAEVEHQLWNLLVQLIEAFQDPMKTELLPAHEARRDGDVTGTPITRWPESAATPTPFHKDDPRHVALVHRLSCVRAGVYHIPLVAEWETKRIAGRVTPALITTTAVVAGFATLQLLCLLATADSTTALTPMQASDEKSTPRTPATTARLRDCNISLQDWSASFVMECTLARARQIETGAKVGGGVVSEVEAAAAAVVSLGNVTSWTKWPLRLPHANATIWEVLQQFTVSYPGLRAVRVADVTTSSLLWDESSSENLANPETFPLLSFLSLLWEEKQRAPILPEAPELIVSCVVDLPDGTAVAAGPIPTVVLVTGRVKRSR